MVRIEESIEIKCLVDKVFAYTTDAENWPKWQSTIPEAERTSEGPVDVGATFKGTIRMMGRSMKWTAKATEYEPNRKFGKNITSGSMAVEQHNSYDPIEGGTKFAIVYVLSMGGAMKPLTTVLAGAMRKKLKKALGDLKNILEESA